MNLCHLKNEDARLRPIRLRTIRLRPAGRNRIGRSRNWPKSKLAEVEIGRSRLGRTRKKELAEVVIGRSRSRSSKTPSSKKISKKIRRVVLRGSDLDNVPSFASGSREHGWCQTRVLGSVKTAIWREMGACPHKLMPTLANPILAQIGGQWLAVWPIWANPMLANPFLSIGLCCCALLSIVECCVLLCVVVDPVLLWTLQTPPRTSPPPDPLPPDRPKFGSFFPPRPHFALFVSLGVFSWNSGGVFVGRDFHMCPFGFSDCHQIQKWIGQNGLDGLAKNRLKLTQLAQNQDDQKTICQNWSKSGWLKRDWPKSVSSVTRCGTRLKNEP